jgi:signal transduction histidine kinase
VPVEALLADVASVAFARFTGDGLFLQANRGFLQAVQVPEGVVHLTDLVAAGQSEWLASMLTACRASPDRRYVHFGVGTGVPVSLLVSWFRDGDELLLIGEPPVAETATTQTMLVKLNQQVTDSARENAKKSAQLERALEDLRAAQTMLVHREKMSALGAMTAGIAHELNNPLAYAKNNLYMLGQGVADLLALIDLLSEGLDAIEASQPALFESIMAKVEQIDLDHLIKQIPSLVVSADQGIERATGLVSGLRTFSRLDEADVKVVDLNESMLSVVEFVGFLLARTHTELKVDFGELPPVTCAPAELNQAVLNILTNAIQASPEDGTVKLATCLVGDEVLISVSDDGPGVPEDIAARIFDPFFTTRPVGDGTGLGLSIAHTVVTAHGGRIALEPGATRGAVFTIHLPIDRWPSI